MNDIITILNWPKPILVMATSFYINDLVAKIINHILTDLTPTVSETRVSFPGGEEILYQWEVSLKSLSPEVRRFYINRK
jgi:hypothetical protein